MDGVSARNVQTARHQRHLDPERSLEPLHVDFGDADRPAQIVQMFGAGCLLQHTAVEYEDKVLLAAGRVENVISTMECT